MNAAFEHQSARIEKMRQIARRYIALASTKYTRGWGCPRSRCALQADYMEAAIKVGDLSEALRRLLQLVDMSWN